ncbi:putative wd repeat-containing protein [Phaeoacremonium minimum UCRPA7]|uniref:Putative wd repeat-containing protein n=1 Tax=Phaeoacremonium minimum (strain UCR-PA7) TaxID=1286976 RepID=R8BCC7_PHAM7|nr:putative wd repeat-containing protein [Phaeoacremonium minimum UCRPA7]EON96940.1 putative wd repeat-containing protein [Phaeoacremonium minimum UCRPA7]
MRPDDHYFDSSPPPPAPYSNWPDDQQSEIADSRNTSFPYSNGFLEDEDARNEQELQEEDHGVDYDEDMSDDDGGVPLWLMNEGGFHGVLLPALEDDTDASDEDSDMANLGHPHNGAVTDNPIQPQEDAAFAPPIPFDTFMDMQDQLQFVPTQATNPPVVSQQLEQLAGFFADEAGGFDGNHPTALSNPNPNTLGPENPGLFDFLRHWAWQSRCLQGLARERGRYPWLPQVNLQASERVPFIGVNHLEGDRFDFQGIDWMKLGVTRREARERRLLTYKNYVNKPGSDRWQHMDVVIPRSESFFRFRRMDVRRNVHLSHFQLRNVLASTSRSQVFYTGNSTVHQFNPISGESRVAMTMLDTSGTHISTLAADHGILIAGGFNGEYCLRRLDSDLEGESEQCYEGTITNAASNITNHVQLHLSRSSSSPRAAFASNDTGFRILDIESETFLSESIFPYPLNCSAMSPDRRLRVMVGDHYNAIITTTDGDGRCEILQELTGHRDFGFACDWADDGWTVATGFQDKAVKIWDARRWTNSQGVSTPVCTIRAEMAGVRSLRFSPLGSGKRVLVAAEEADYVDIIDAQTFRRKQTIDLFGEIGGASFANDGQDLYVLCCDRVRGGVLQLERCGLGTEATHDPTHQFGEPRWKDNSFDWPEYPTTSRRVARASETRRRRRALAAGELEPF